MKRVVLAATVVAAIALLFGLAFAQMGWGPMGPGGGGGYGPGMGWGPGMMGPGMGIGPGGYGCPGMGWSGQSTPTQLTEESAKQLGQQYADRYFKGFNVDKVLPFTGMGGMTMYSIELKGPKDEVRTLHVNPWGNVMPFGGPWRRG